MDLLETLLVLVAVVAGVVEGSPNGVPYKQSGDAVSLPPSSLPIIITQPTDAKARRLCHSMEPNHGYSTQLSPPPFVLKLNATEVMGGEALEIRVTAAVGEDPLAGLFLMVQKQRHDRTPQGHFTSVTPADQMELLNHFYDRTGGAIGHLTDAVKPEVVAVWVAPEKPNADDEFVVVATMVRSLRFFWARHYFPQGIKVKSNLTTSTGTGVTENKPGGASQIKTAALFPSVSQQTHFGARILQQFQSLAAASVIASMCLVK